MNWPWEIVERDHDIQNPTSPEKIRLLGEYVRLGRDSRVLDIACGKGGPALVLASTFGCRILGIEKRPVFAEEARARVKASGLESLIEVRTADASELELEPEAWDAALCLGASFVWARIGDAAAALVPAVRSGGFVAIGEPFLRRSAALDEANDGGYEDLDATAARFETAGVSITGLIAASDDDWDRYESLHWRAAEEWLAGPPNNPDTESIRAQYEGRRNDYFRSERDLFGWAMFIGRKP
jgi:SAM-dependent methyltransferase